MVLLLGSGGYVGKRFVEFFHHKSINYITLSIRNKENPEQILSDFIKSFKPHYVINCIGHTGKPNVDACENYKIQTMHCNVTLAGVVAKICKEHNVPLGFVSSGCIYDNTHGDSNKVYTENDLPNFDFITGNCSWYSGTKSLGEELVMSLAKDNTWIWRLRIPFNHIPSDKNYIFKLLNYEKLWSFPNSVSNIDEFIQTCYYSMIKDVPKEIYNIVNPDPITAKRVIEIAKEEGVVDEDKEFKFFDDVEEFEKNVKTPRSNCILSSERIRNEGFGLLSSEESIRKSFKSWNQKDNTIFW